LISPIESACILNSPLPSPLNNDADTEPVINVFALIVSVSDAGVSIIDVSILEAEKGIAFTILIEFGEALITGLPLT
jgi:hypothetical protein